MTTFNTQQIFTPGNSVTTPVLSATSQVVTLPAVVNPPTGSVTALVIMNPNATPALVQLLSSAPPANLPPPQLNPAGAISVRGGCNLLIVSPSSSATVALVASATGGGTPITLVSGYVTADAVRFSDVNFPQNIVYTAGQTQ